MNQKRIRSLNWDEEEKQLLRSVLKEYAQIIENKCLDTNTNKMKIKAWEEVHKKFNELNSRHRQLSQLKIQWKTMKVYARKTYSTYNKEVNKTGGGARPTTPSDAVSEIKDLLNPAELLRDHNMYDSDGIISSSSENKVLLATTSETCASTLQDSNSDMVKALENNNIINLEDQQIDNIFIETIEDVDAQVNVRETTPLVVSQDNTTVDTPMKKNMDGIQAKISQENIIMATPVTKSMGTILAKKVPKRKIILNQIPGNSLKSRKDHDEYINSMLSHSKMLKDEEHMRRMEMAEEEHAIKMEIHKEELAIKKEKLKCAKLETEILEFKVCEMRS